MKVANSLRSLKSRHRDCQVVRRKGRVYVINKTQKRYKGRPWETGAAFCVTRGSAAAAGVYSRPDCV